MNLSNQDIQLGQNMFVSSATQNHPLGTRGYTQDGRAFRYAKCGASTALVAGNVIQSGPVVTGNLVLAVNTTSAVSVGSTALSLTAVSAAAANLYAEGHAAIASGAGLGYLYTVNNHALVSTGATGVFNLYGPEDALVVAITTTSVVSFLKNKYSGVIVAPITTATGIIVGVAPYVIAVDQFGWLQTWGTAAVIIEGTPAAGSPVVGITVSAAGAAAAPTAAALLTNQIIGYMQQIGVATQANFIDLRIAP